MTLLSPFRDLLNQPDLPAVLRAGLIGENAVVTGPYGPKPMVYADYVASGRALRGIEEFILEHVLPYYANSHTRASYCGSMMTELREETRAEIARLTDAGPGTSVVFCGSGSTAGLNRLALLLDLHGTVARGERAVVLVGPYEHHSNLLPWRESGAEVVEIAEGDCGGPCMDHLTQELQRAQGAEVIVGAFGAASNVTGILTDTKAVTRLLKSHGALAIWDYGCAAPYVPMSMDHGTDHAKDAIVCSPHKFPGGPGASGLMILRDAIARRTTPTLPGGGTVTFVSPWGHRYSNKLTAREEGGTPNVVGDIRAGLCLLVKEAMGAAWLAQRQSDLRARAEAVWSKNPRLEILGKPIAGRLPIFSFRVRDGAGGYVHHQLFTRMLSDVYGVQARGGCACAGSYAHRLLGLDADASQAVMAALDAGLETEKPGWVRLNLSALMSDAKADFVISAVDELARCADRYTCDYLAETSGGRFVPKAREKPLTLA